MHIKDGIKQFILYLIVGGIATVVEWVAFYFLDSAAGMHYMAATALAFVISTFANWLFGRLILFHSGGHIVKELVQIYLTSIMGLAFNLLIMWVTVDCLNWNTMFSKIVATGLVFFWNFLVRKFLIYRT